MPNPTTIHDAAQTVLREIERTQNMEPLEIGPLLFESRYAMGWRRINIYADGAKDTYISEADATKLVAMILETFPRIREQFKDSKP